MGIGSLVSSTGIKVWFELGGVESYVFFPFVELESYRYGLDYFVGKALKEVNPVKNIHRTKVVNFVREVVIKYRKNVETY